MVCLRAGAQDSEAVLISDEDDDEVFIVVAPSEDDPGAVQEIVITAPVDNNDPRLVSSQVVVITAEEIRAAAPRSAADIVAPVMGVQIDRYGGAAEPAVISIRGSSPEQVLVLVNGRRLNSAQGGGVDLSTISPDDIARIEVVRGGASALYGENAMGGVVNIITKEGYSQDPGVDVSGAYGSFDTVNGDLAIHGQSVNGALDYFLSASGMMTEGGYTYSDEHAEDGENQRDNCDGKKLDLSGRIGAAAGAGRVSLSGQAHLDEKGVPGLVEFPTPDARMEDCRYSGLLSVDAPTGAGRIICDLSWVNQKRNYSNPDYYSGPVDDEHNNNALSGEAGLTRTDFIGLLSLVSSGGYAFRYDQLVSTALLTGSDGTEESGRVSRLQHAGFLRSELQTRQRGGGESGFPAFSLFPAVRYEWNRILYEDAEINNTTDALSFNLGFRMPFGENELFIIKANCGRSYRVPSFDDLFWPATSFAIGNPELEPEEALTGDFGLVFQPMSRWIFEAVIFDQEVTNLIQWTPGPSGQWQPGNIGSARLFGGEFEVRGILDVNVLSSVLDIKGNCTLLYPVDLTEGTAATGKILPRKPRIRMNLAGTLTHPAGHSLRLEGRYVGERFITARNTESLDSYFVLDGTVNWQMSPGWHLLCSVKNILNQEYVDMQEYPIPGMEMTLEAGYSL